MFHILRATPPKTPHKASPYVWLWGDFVGFFQVCIRDLFFDPAQVRWGQEGTESNFCKLKLLGITWLSSRFPKTIQWELTETFGCLVVVGSCVGKLSLQCVCVNVCECREKNSGGDQRAPLWFGNPALSALSAECAASLWKAAEESHRDPIRDTSSALHCRPEPQTVMKIFWVYP